ncbi:MAG TPA: hypothetical protein VMW35_01645 [Myxococcota bacterium]|jgi:hypothetical protein|nr:hypothetical protein [Myxococcota bacterium]
MRRRPKIELAAALILAVTLGLTAAPAAPAGETVEVHVTVAEVSDRPGAVEPGAASLYQALSRDFRYRSVRLVESRDFRLGLNETGSLRLPTGRWLTVKPRKMGPSGVLMAVEIEGRLRTTLRMPSHHEVLIGAEPFGDGKLVVTLEPRF